MGSNGRCAPPRLPGYLILIGCISLFLVRCSLCLDPANQTEMSTVNLTQRNMAETNHRRLHSENTSKNSLEGTSFQQPEATRVKNLGEQAEVMPVAPDRTTYQTRTCAVTSEAYKNAVEAVVETAS